MAKFCGTGIHVVGVHVRRVAKHEFVAFVTKTGEKIGFHEPDAVLEAMLAHVDRCNREGIVRDIHGIHVGVRKRVSGGDRDAAAAGAKVCDAAHAVGRDPWLEARLDEFRERRTGHQDTLVDIEAQTTEPGLVEEVSQRLALVDAARSQVLYCVELVVVNILRIRLRRILVREAQGGKHEPGRLVHGVVGTVSVGEPGCFEARRDSPNELLDVHAARIYHQ